MANLLTQNLTFSQNPRLVTLPSCLAPSLSNTPTLFTTTMPNSTSQPADRPKRQLLAGAAVISGILGTFLGLFNAYEISQLQNQMQTQQNNQNMLIDISKQQERHLSHLDVALKELYHLVEYYVASNPTMVQWYPGNRPAGYRNSQSVIQGSGRPYNRPTR